MLAPQSGITDSAFRQLAMRNGADVVFTEFTSVDGLAYSSAPSLERLKFDASEHPVVCQIFGNKPKFFSEATKKVEAAGFDGVDINFGCPAKKVVGNQGGVSCMRDLTLVRQIVEATCEAAQKIPVSIKIRRSIKLIDNNGKALPQEHTALDLLDTIKDLPIAAMTIHGRSYERPFTGEPDFAMIAEVKKRFNGLVIGNGGINTVTDAKNMLDKTGVDGLALARGIYGKPWLFRQIHEYLKTGKYAEVQWNVIIETAVWHAELMFTLKGERGIVEMRKHLGWYFKGFPGASEVRKELMQIKNPSELRSVISSFNLTAG